ncbi:MAG: alpha/beta hydrolase [Pseudomonadota bacterium]
MNESQFLFVPGGQRTKQDFDSVRSLLEADCHETDAITLSDPREATLTNHIDEVCALIEQSGAKRLHLVGHSYASFVITGAADRVFNKIERLIFLDTLIPENGKSLLDLFADAEIDPGGFGVPSWPPFIEKLFFDARKLAEVRKTYVHCLNGQFLALTHKAVHHVKTHEVQEHWTHIEIEADHYCMIKEPKLVLEALR